MPLRTITVSVVGTSGIETIKGSEGVGKSLICNRFVRGSYDEFITDHCSVISQSDFGGSRVINNDQWLYWGEREIECDETGASFNIRVIEQTEFLDDETFMSMAGPSTEDYSVRCSKTKLESRDKLMYIRKEQLGLETEFPSQVLSDGKCQVDCFIVVFDSSYVEGRSFDRQINYVGKIISNIVKTKKPFVVAISKCDAMDEDCGKAVHVLNMRKELNNTHPQVEVSSLLNVNIDELFIVAAMTALKGKIRLKVAPYAEAHRNVIEMQINSRRALADLLNKELPIERWNIRRITWELLRQRLASELNPDYCNFVRLFGQKAAKEAYDKHANDAREFWMNDRLSSLMPKFPLVFPVLLSVSDEDLSDLSWSEAKQIIRSHPLFDEYFLPLGTIGRMFDPASPTETLYMGRREEKSLPAEVLLRDDAEQYFKQYKQVKENQARLIYLKKEFMDLLGNTPEVTPGIPLQEVAVFLHGSKVYEALTPKQVVDFYEQFQHQCIERAEKELVECMLENVELFLDVIRTNCSDDHGLRLININLQTDYRYAALWRRPARRDSLLLEFASFIARPTAIHCPSREFCLDVSIKETMTRFFNGKPYGTQSAPHFVDITVHGDKSMVLQFLTDMNALLLLNDPYPCSCGFAKIRCYSAAESSSDSSLRTQLYILDSIPAVDSCREATIHPSQSPLPALFVPVCDPSHFDLLPYLHSQGIELAEITNGNFIQAGTSDDSKGSDSCSIFGHDQLIRICDTVCSSQLDGRQADMRIQVSLLCGDKSVDTLLHSLFSNNSLFAISPIINPNLISVGIVPMDISLPSCSYATRVDIRISSYHSWLCSRTVCSTHAHILVYSAKRGASMAHARTAVRRVLDDGWHTVSGKAIMLIAITDPDTHDFRNDKETNLLITEGSDLATSIGAHFIILSSNSVLDSKQSEYLVDFFDKVHGMIPLLKPSSLERSTNKRQSDGYATLSEFRNGGGGGGGNSDQNTYAAYKNTYCGSMQPTSTTVIRPTAFSKELPSVMSTSLSISDMQPTYPQYDSNSTSRIRRRARPPMAPLRLIPLKDRNAHIAPLATPEAIEIASEYSTAQIHDDGEEHIYASLDDIDSTQNREDSKSISSSEKSVTSAAENKEKKRPLRSRMFSNHSSTEPTSSPSLGTVSPNQPSSAGGNDRVRPLSACLSTTSMTSPLLAPSPSSTTRSAVTSPIRPNIATKPLFLSPPSALTSASRSNTFDMFSVGTMSAIVRAREIIDDSKDGKRRNFTTHLAGMRHSHSAESLVEKMHDTKKKTRAFGGRLHKMTSSFRFRKGTPTSNEQDHKMLNVSPSTHSESRSLPQSPHTTRKADGKKNSTTSSEKSSTFSWLPTRSPKRTHKLQAESVSSLEALCEKAGSIPLFLTKCVDYIEKNGGLEMEGLYRLSGNQSQLLELEGYRETGNMDLDKMNLPVHVLTTAVKNFFNKLPEPLVPHSSHQHVLNAVDSDQIADRLTEVFSNLSVANRDVLGYFCNHLLKVAASPATSMNLKNLSKVFFPTIFRPDFQSMEEVAAGVAKFENATEMILMYSAQIFHSRQAPSL